MIYITVTNKKWSPGAKYLREYPLKVQDDFDKYIAIKYVSEIQRCIQKQTLPWKKLNSKYLKKKKELHLSKKTWEATRSLRDNLKVIERNYFYEIGWEKGLKPKKVKGFNDKSNLTILQIARKLEYGDLKTPPRALFRPVHRRMEKDMSFYVKEFLKRNNPDKKLSYQLIDKVKSLDIKKIKESKTIVNKKSIDDFITNSRKKVKELKESKFVSKIKTNAKKGRDLFNEFFGL